MHATAYASEEVSVQQSGVGGSGAPGALAADRDDCQRRIAKTERKLNDAIEDHGYYSKQAEHWRHERREAYERCYGREYRNNWDRDRDCDRY